MKTDRSDTTERKGPNQRAMEFLAGIVDGSPEDDSRIWFENATPAMRLAAFIRLDVRESDTRDG